MISRKNHSYMIKYLQFLLNWCNFFFFFTIPTQLVTVCVNTYSRMLEIYCYVFSTFKLWLNYNRTDSPSNSYINQQNLQKPLSICILYFKIYDNHVKYFKCHIKAIQTDIQYVSDFPKFFSELPWRNWPQSLLNIEPTLYLISHDRDFQSSGDF